MKTWFQNRRMKEKRHIQDGELSAVTTPAHLQPHASLMPFHMMHAPAMTSQPSYDRTFRPHAVYASLPHLATPVFPSSAASLPVHPYFASQSYAGQHPPELYHQTFTPTLAASVPTAKSSTNSDEETQPSTSSQPTVKVPESTTRDVTTTAPHTPLIVCPPRFQLAPSMTSSLAAALSVYI